MPGILRPKIVTVGNDREDVDRVTIAAVKMNGIDPKDGCPTVKAQ